MFVRNRLRCNVLNNVDAGVYEGGREYFITVGLCFCSHAQSAGYKEAHCSVIYIAHINLEKPVHGSQQYLALYPLQQLARWINQSYQINAHSI